MAQSLISSPVSASCSLAFSRQPLGGARAFGVPSLVRPARPVRIVRCAKEEGHVVAGGKVEERGATSALTSAAAIAPILLAAQDAAAKDGEFGILEGRTVALIHPAVMIFFFGYTLYAGYLGYQWRRIRTIGDEISALKKQVPASAEGAPPSPVEQQIAVLTEERKSLTKGGFRDKHWNAGSILLGGGVTIAIGGCVDTWFRTGKLFPGPHLFAGAAIVILWAVAASLVPAMQKGDDKARSAHIALNAVNVALFAWQLPTGFDIVDKVFKFTSWP